MDGKTMNLDLTSDINMNSKLTMVLTMKNKASAEDNLALE